MPLQLGTEQSPGNLLEVQNLEFIAVTRIEKEIVRSGKKSNPEPTTSNMGLIFIFFSPFANSLLV